MDGSQGSAAIGLKSIAYARVKASHFRGCLSQVSKHRKKGVQAYVFQS